MKKMKFLTYVVIVLLLGFAMNSCKGDDGSAGADGIDGVDGQDGNANVTSITLMASSITWTAGFYFSAPSNVYFLTDDKVNQDIIDHGMILGFAHFFAGGINEWVPLPFDYESTNTPHLTYTYLLNTINLYAYTTIGAWDPNPAFPEYRFLLVTDNTVLGGKSTNKDIILEELKNAGIDSNNYYEVCDYYGINP